MGSPTDASGLVDAAVGLYGQLDILINNAAIQIEKTIEELEPDEWDALMNVNFKGVYCL